MVNLNKFFKGYVSKLDQSISEISVKKLTAASTLLKNTIKKGRTIYVCGNGGSAAIANHYVCDFLKYFSDSDLSEQANEIIIDIEIRLGTSEVPS